MWTTVVFNSEDETISFSLKNKEHVINCDIMNACFKLPENTVTTLPSDVQSVNMLYTMNYFFSY